MAYAGPREDIYVQEDGWIHWTLNTVKSLERAAETNIIILLFLLALAPFLWIFAIVMAPVFFILICALVTAFICLLIIVSFLVCGSPVYVIFTGYGFIFMLFLISRLDQVGFKVQFMYAVVLDLYCIITGFPSRMYHNFKRKIREIVQEVRRAIGEDVLKCFNL